MALYGQNVCAKPGRVQGFTVHVVAAQNEFYCNQYVCVVVAQKKVLL